MSFLVYLVEAQTVSYLGQIFALECELGIGVEKTCSSLVLCFLAEFTGTSRSSDTVKTSLCYLLHLECCDSESC